MRWVSAILAVSQVLAYRQGLGHDDLELTPRGDEKAKSSPDAMPGLLLWFLVLDMIFLYLSNTTYALMRENFFRMVSYTISIFCAILLHLAVTNLALEGLTSLSPELSDLAPVLFLTLLFPAWFFGISFLTWLARESRESTVAVGGIVAHTAAFAGIDLSKHLQHRAARDFGEQATTPVLVLYLASPVVAIIVCKVFSHASSWIRRKRLMTVFEERKKVHWAEEAKESELEGAAILLGFLLRGAILILVQQKMPKHSGQIEEPLAAPVLFLTIGGLLCAKSILAALTLESDLVKFLQLLLGMTACWSFMSLIMYDIKQNITMSDHRWLFLVATVSALVFVSMFVMGYMADWRLLRPKQLSELVVVCGVATGLAWEKSFAWAVREVVKNDALWYNQQVLELIRRESPFAADMAQQLKLLEVGCYLAILAVVMPAWRWYIVPLALSTAP